MSKRPAQFPDSDICLKCSGSKIARFFRLRDLLLGEIVSNFSPRDGSVGSRHIDLSQADSIMDSNSSLTCSSDITAVEVMEPLEIRHDAAYICE